MNNKVLIKLYVPNIDKDYDIWIPINKRIYNVINLLIKVINEFNGDYYKPIKMPNLYDKLTAKQYDVNLTVKETNIKNGSHLILI